MNKKLTMIAICSAAFFLWSGCRAQAAENAAPKLLRLGVQTAEGGYDKATITFSTDGISTCYIYRKKAGDTFKRIGKVRSDGGVTRYTDRTLPTTGRYIYTVTARTTGFSGDTISGYDKEGLSTIRGKSTVHTVVTNLRTRVSWTPNKNATFYNVYRKFENKGWKCIATVDKNHSNYTDIYSNTFSSYEKKNYLLNNCFLDTSSHTVSYTVRGVKRYSDFDKLSLSPYQGDGYFNLNAPLIVRANRRNDGSVTLSFTAVPYARRYEVSACHRNTNGTYKRIVVSSVNRTKEAYIDCNVTPVNNFDYYTVTAFAYRNGKEIRSSSRDGFTLKYRNFSYKKILYIGDSITYGTPYKTDINKYIFSYPWRVRQLTGASYYNAAIPGATLANNYRNSAIHRYRIINDVVPLLSIGATPNGPMGLLKQNRHPIEYYDTIVICAGTNDYADQVALGTKNSNKKNTYYGALNRLMHTISLADEKRVKAGESHIEVIMPDLFYSDRCYAFTKRRSRYETKNGIGYTLTDYNNAKNTILKKYQKKGLHLHRFKTSRFINKVNCPYATADNLHMTRYTYEKIGNSLTSFMIRIWQRSS